MCHTPPAFVASPAFVTSRTTFGPFISTRFLRTLFALLTKIALKSDKKSK